MEGVMSQIKDLSTFFRAIRIANNNAPYHEAMGKQEAFARLSFLATGEGPLAHRARVALLESDLVPVIRIDRARKSDGGDAA